MPMDLTSQQIQREKLARAEYFFNRCKNLRPKPKRNLDQFLATAETVLKRTTLLGDSENISQKKVIFLGDDDLTSLVVSFFYNFKKVTVVDIDGELLNFIAGVAKKEKLAVEVFKHDLRNPLPKEFRDYDIVFFDPPYTPQAVSVWLNRAVEVTLGTDIAKQKKTPELLSSKQYFMCYGYTDRSTERGLAIQKIISDCGFVIQEKMRKFNTYYGATSIGSASDLYILTPTPKVNLRKLDIKRTQFYTGQKFRSSH